MSATRLLVLGMVRACGRAHGYQLGRDLLSWGADEWANTKWGSIYHALKQLTKQEMLASHDVEKGDAGQPRTEYEITGKGEAEFFRLVRDALSKPEKRPDTLAAALAMMTALPRDEVISLLKERLGALERTRDSITAQTSDWERSGQVGHVRELFDLWIDDADNGARWTRGLVARLEDGAYIMANEAHPNFGAPGSAAQT